MNRTFASEDLRKEGLFDSWIEYLRNYHSQNIEHGFEEFYEGTAVVSGLSKNRMDLHLDDGRKLRNIPISPAIRRNSARLDMIFIVLGFSQGNWWPLDVISIGSIVGEQIGAHVTFNPLHLANPNRPPLAVLH